MAKVRLASTLVTPDFHGGDGLARPSPPPPPWAPRNDFATAFMNSPNPSLQLEVASLLVEALNLDTQPESIDPNAPLYGEGLGLDSIDILEVALVVSQRYGFQLRSDDADNVRIFTSLASLTEHIATHRLS